ncbi:hypothetical protein VIGAN_06146600, partial [Vigna angularis var. angularis]
MNDGKIVPKSRKFFASATECTHTWNGIQQDITRCEQHKVIYEVTALVRIFGNNVSIPNVRATLWVQASNLKEQYVYRPCNVILILYVRFSPSCSKTWIGFSKE